MADYNVNSGTQKRFELGGTLEIVSGADTYTVVNIEAGSVSWREGRRAIYEGVDRGTLLQPTLGDKQHSEIEFAIKCATLYGSNSLQSLVSLASVTDNLVPEYTVTITIFDDLGQTTGESFTFANSYFTSGMNWSSGGSGAERDMARFTMRSRTNEPARAAIT